MDKDTIMLIKRIVDYKWNGDGEYSQIYADINNIADPTIREKLLNYLDEANEFSSEPFIEKEVEKELLETWLLDAKPFKMRYKAGKYLFELKDEKE